MRTVHVFLLVSFILVGEPFFDFPRTYLGSSAFQFKLKDAVVANGHTLLLECFPLDYDADALSTESRNLASSMARAMPEESASSKFESGPAIRHGFATSGAVPRRFYPHPTEPPGVLFALIGVPYHRVPGLDTLYVEWTELDRMFSEELIYRVVEGPYRSEQIRGVPQNRVTPSDDDYRRIARERKLIAAAYEAVLDSIMMEDDFSFHVKKRTITSPYGTRRVFNGQLRSYHSGLDLRAYEGTPIYAAQSGIVKLAQNLFYSGNHVLIEHGMGIHSGYSHLSKISVKTGDRVEQGQLLGLSGATGRVTAAHLHWTVNIHGVGVSPLQLVETLDALYKRKMEEITELK